MDVNAGEVHGTSHEGPSLNTFQKDTALHPMGLGSHCEV